jgi:phage tail-like protein
MPTSEHGNVSHVELKLGGHAVLVFRECSGMGSETEITEHRATDARGKPFVHKVAGATKWSNITLKRGVDMNKTLWDWRQQVITEGPNDARVDGTITLMNADGTPILTYSFLQGWPVKYGGVTLNASTNDVALEEIVIVHEGLSREPS